MAGMLRFYAQGHADAPEEMDDVSKGETAGVELQNRVGGSLREEMMARLEGLSRFFPGRN